MASPNLSEIVTTTLRHRSKKLADNVTNNNALLMRMSERGRIKTVPGGRTIVQELEYQENGTSKWYSGYEVLDISPSDVLTAAEFDYKQLSVAVTISGLEMLQNSGSDAVIDLLEARISNAEKTMKNTVCTAMYSDGTGTGGKEIGGLQLLVSDSSSSGTVGGISRTDWTFWRNEFIDNGTAYTSSSITSDMNEMYTRLVRNADKPDLIMADNETFLAYLESLQAVQRITDPKLGAAGFATLQFMGNIPVVLDGGKGGNCPTGHMYFLNTDYIHWRPHRDRNMVPLDPDRFSVNQDAMVKLIGWAGNMTISNCSLQGVIYG